MAAPYNHRAIEAKWRTNWEKKPVNVNDGKKPKYYCLDMFPYPSGNGLHVGHWRGYVISDVWSRYKMLQGYYLIHPMGWDAFGLPAENYAIKMGVHPAVSTAANIKNIKRQINDIAAIYDWDMEVNTTDPEFYKWTQKFIFHFADFIFSEHGNFLLYRNPYGPHRPHIRYTPHLHIQEAAYFLYPELPHIPLLLQPEYIFPSG